MKNKNNKSNAHTVPLTRGTKRGKKIVLPHLFPMISTIIWNIRGVRSKGAFERLIKLVKIHKVFFVTLQEPFVDKMYLEVFRRELGFDNAASNKNGKIWCFWDHNITCTVVKDHRQQITFIVKHAQFMQNFCIAAIYAKTSSQKRMRLWNSLRKIKDHVDGPWAIFGDFNVITHADEKNGGRMHRLAQSLDFLNCMGDCGMMDAGYVGNPFTWTNGRRKTKKISKRLDRVMYNDEWSEFCCDSEASSKNRLRS